MKQDASEGSNVANGMEMVNRQWYFFFNVKEQLCSTEANHHQWVKEKSKETFPTIKKCYCRTDCHWMSQVSNTDKLKSVTN